MSITGNKYFLHLAKLNRPDAAWHVCAAMYMQMIGVEHCDKYTNMSSST